MEIQYLAIAIQYYVAGRSATFAHSMPVAGNLFHHAVEMVLKSFLVNSYSPIQLKKQFGHNLGKIWDEFKKVADDPALDKFDGLVSELNEVEDLRYPEKGYIFNISIYKGPPPKASGEATKDIKQYVVNLEEVDELLTALLSGRVTPGWIAGLLRSDDALAQYKRENKHPFF